MARRTLRRDDKLQQSVYYCKQCVFLERAVASRIYILCKEKNGLYFLLNCMSYLFGLLILCLASISLCYAKLWTAGISKTFENAHECSQSSHASMSFSFAGSIFLNSHNDTHNIQDRSNVYSFLSWCEFLNLAAKMLLHGMLVAWLWAEFNETATKHLSISQNIIVIVSCQLVTQSQPSEILAVTSKPINYDTWNHLLNLQKE